MMSQPPGHAPLPQLPLLPSAPSRALALPSRRHRAHNTRPAPVEGSFCNYSHRVCMQNRLEGYEYCIKHILEDKASPFRQCNYVSQTGKRCPNATPKADKKNEGYCQDHASRVTMVKQRALRKRKPKETPETLLADLNHYTSHEPKRPVSLAARALEYAVSSSDSESESALVEQAWRGDGDSDAESVDSEQEDPLKHAGVYTAEEVALITRDKLIRLQSLYIDQFKRLQHLLKEKRRRYIHSVRAERERMVSIGYAKEDPEQREDYDTLQAMKRYHRRHGMEALLQRQSKERRIQVSDGLHYRPPNFPKCVHAASPHAPNTRCSERTVPLSKYCKMHIAMGDVHQVLYRPCGYGGVEEGCTVPVPALNPLTRCPLHTQLVQDVPTRIPPRRLIPESSSEDEEKDLSVDVTTVEAPEQAYATASAPSALSSAPTAPAIAPAPIIAPSQAPATAPAPMQTQMQDANKTAANPQAPAQIQAQANPQAPQQPATLDRPTTLDSQAPRPEALLPAPHAGNQGKGNV